MKSTLGGALGDRPIGSIALAIVIAIGTIRADARVFGRDERLDPAATQFTPLEVRKYSSIGRVECPKKNGNMATATAFLIGDFKTMATAAHAFYDDSDLSKYDVTKCSVNFYRPDGTLLETVGIREVRTRWDDRKLLRDESNDIAIIRLATEPRTPAEISVVLKSENVDLYDETPVILVAYQGGFSNDTERRRLRKSKGVATWAATYNVHTFTSERDDTPLKSPAYLGAGSYDSAPGSSGGPIFNEAGQIIGMNEGSASETGEFNPSSAYNAFVTFDGKFIAEINAIVRNQAP